MSKTGWIIAIAAVAAVTFTLATGCRIGWDAGFCADNRASIAPFIGGGSEFMLTEVMSLIGCMIGLIVAYQSYIDGNAPRVRLAALFLVFFTIALIGENNLVRDDVRPQMLIVLLVWISVEMLIARSPLALALLLLGVLVPALGQLGDNTTQIQFEGVFGIPLSQSVLAPWVNAIGVLEEMLELGGWLLFVVAAAVSLDVRPIARDRYRFMTLATAAIIAIAIGNSGLHLSDDNLAFESLRKIGLFCSVAGVACAGAALLLRHAKRGALAQAYCALFIVAAYWIAVYAPTHHMHQHSKTISSWVWIFPIFAGYYALVRFRRGYVRSVAPPSRSTFATQSPT